MEEPKDWKIQDAKSRSGESTALRECKARGAAAA